VSISNVCTDKHLRECAHARSSDSEMDMLSIQELRAVRGWSQEDLADALGVTQATISNWERGRSQPTIMQFGALAIRFGVSIGSISLPPRPRLTPRQPVAQGD
jgi:transcriptional regulator with XRE-family HTH domain